mgnify:CR=1 FL=1
MGVRIPNVSGLPRARCLAKTKMGDGPPCQNFALPNGRCKWHGGMSLPAGPSHPRYKHGRYSKDLPARLREGYERALIDPDLLNRRQDLALISARISELLSKLESSGGAQRDELLRDQAKLYRSSSRISDPAKRAEAQGRAIFEMIQLIENGVGDEVWTEIGAMIDRYNRVADGERKRLESLHASITADQAMVMFDSLTSLVLEHVTDPATREKIGLDFAKLTASVLGGADTTPSLAGEFRTAV